MDGAVVNSFLDRFISVADTGFGLIQGDVSYVLNALIVISIVLAGAQWALAQEAAIAPFFRKVLFVGLFAFLINNWNALATAINQSGAALGLRAGGGGLTLPDLHNPARVAGIGGELFARTVQLSAGMNIITDAIAMATIFLAAVCVMLAFFVLAFQVFAALIAFKLGSLAAFVALPWGVFNGTAWVAERPLGWVAGSAMRLFVLGFIASVTVTFVDSLPLAFTLDFGGVLNILLFGLTILGLSWFAPQLASEIVQGQPQLSGGDIVRAGGGVAQSAITTAATLKYIASHRQAGAARLAARPRRPAPRSGARS